MLVRVIIWACILKYCSLIVWRSYKYLFKKLLQSFRGQGIWKKSISWFNAKITPLIYFKCNFLKKMGKYPLMGTLIKCYLKHVIIFKNFKLFWNLKWNRFIKIELLEIELLIFKNLFSCTMYSKQKKSWLNNNNPHHK